MQTVLRALFHRRGPFQFSLPSLKLFVFRGKGGSTTPDVSTDVITVQEGSGDELHVSYSFDDAPDTNDFSDGSACINSSDFSIATDDTETCWNITGALESAFTFDWQSQVTAV